MEYEKLKRLIYENGHTLSDINRKMNLINHENKTVQNLSNKLNRKTIKYSEVLQILDILDYEILVSRKLHSNEDKYKNEISDELCFFTFQ